MNNVLKIFLLLTFLFCLPANANNTKEIKLNADVSNFKTETTNAIKKQEESLSENVLKPKSQEEQKAIETKNVENKLPYNFLDVNAIPIKLSIVETISTKNDLYEGQKIKFVVVEKVIYNKKIILHKGDIVEATIENIITPGMNGFPAEIVLDNFTFPNINNTQLMSTVIQSGSNRCFWVYPLKWALTPIPLAGSLTNFIRGGNAKIDPKDTITIYYYPNWK